MTHAARQVLIRTSDSNSHIKMIHFLAPVCHVTLYAFTPQACALQMLLNVLCWQPQIPVQKHFQTSFPSFDFQRGRGDDDFHFLGEPFL